MNSIRDAVQGSTAYTVSPNVLVPLSWACVGLTAAFLGVRTYIRFWLIPQQRKAWPDFWLYLSFLFLVVDAVLATLMTPTLRNDIPSKGLPISTPQAIEYTRLQFAYMIVFWSVLWAIKGAFLALFKPLLVSTSSHNMQRPWWTVATFTIITYLTCWVAAFLTNNPVSVSETDKSGSFSMFFDDKRRILVLYSTIVDILTTIFIITLPVRLIWAFKTKLSTSQRIALACVFAVSFVIVGIALVRGIALAGRAESKPVWVIVWSSVEAAIAVIVGCLPTYKALFSSRTGPFLSRRSRSEITEITSITPRHSTTTLNSARGADDFRTGYERKSSKESRANSTTPILVDDAHIPVFEESRPQEQSWTRQSHAKRDAPLEVNESFKPVRAAPVNGSISPYSKAWIPPNSTFRSFAFNQTPPSPSPSHANTLPENLYAGASRSPLSQTPNYTRRQISPPPEAVTSVPKHTSNASRLRRKSDSQNSQAPSHPPRAFAFLRPHPRPPSPQLPSISSAPKAPPPPPSHLCPPVRKQTPLTTPILETPPPTAGQPPLSPLKRNPSSVYSIPLSPGIHQVRPLSSSPSTQSTALPQFETSRSHTRSNTLTSEPPIMSPRIENFSETESPVWLTKPNFPGDGL